MRVHVLDVHFQELSQLCRFYLDICVVSDLGTDTIAHTLSYLIQFLNALHWSRTWGCSHQQIYDLVHSILNW